MSEKEPKLYEIEKNSIDSKELGAPENKETSSKIEEISHREKSAELARENINELAKNTEDITKGENLKEDRDDDIKWTSAELLSQTFQRTITSTRNRLSKPEKTLSKVIHQPIVEKVSDISSNTIARPSGILFGSIFSILGSLAGYLLARRLGGELPYSIFAFLFIGGFFFGILVELLWRAIKAKRKSK